MPEADMADLTPSVPSIERALLVLETLSTTRTGMTVSQLARKTGMSKSTAHCVMLTLERHQYLHRDEHSRYLVSTKLFTLATRCLKAVTLRIHATPCLHALARQTGLTVHLAVREATEFLLVDKIEPPVPTRVATRIGKAIDGHCTAVGKVLLADLTEEEQDRWILEHGLLRHNENTIRSQKRLKDELEKTRRRGWAFDDEEEEIGMRCVGAPVFDQEGRTVAAVSVSGSTSQITLETLDLLREQLRVATLAISRNLGYGADAIDPEGDVVSGNPHDTVNPSAVDRLRIPRRQSPPIP
jgi:DNA-binding IclR family transcriptional regulator